MLKKTLLRSHQNNGSSIKNSQKDNKNRPPLPKPEKKVYVALAIYTEQKIALRSEKSQQFNNYVLKLPVLRHNTAKHGEFDEEKMKEVLLKKFLGKGFDCRNAIYSTMFTDKDYNFAIHYVKLDLIKNGIDGNLSFRKLTDLNKNHKHLPFQNHGIAIVLPSVVAAVNDIVNNFCKHGWS